MIRFKEFIEEAEYQGKKVKLNDPFRAPKVIRRSSMCM